jgi:hypothetical protein
MIHALSSLELVTDSSMSPEQTMLRERIFDLALDEKEEQKCLPLEQSLTLSKTLHSLPG